MTATAVSQPSRIVATRVPLWPSVVAFVGIVVALSVYLVVTLSSGKSSPAGPTSNVHPGGNQYNQACVPAPSTRFC